MEAAAKGDLKQFAEKLSQQEENKDGERVVGRGILKIFRFLND